MKTIYLVFIASFLAGCSSVTSLEDVRKQEDEARSDLLEAEEELIELAEMKEAYSVDSKETAIEALEGRQKQINSDIKSLKKIESKGLTKTSDSMIKGLKKEDDDIKARIKSLKKLEDENWEAPMDSINDLIDQLEIKINMITSNLEE